MSYKPTFLKITFTSDDKIKSKKIICKGEYEYLLSTNIIKEEFTTTQLLEDELVQVKITQLETPNRSTLIYSYPKYPIE